MADEAKPTPAEEQDEKEGRELPLDLLTLQRIVRAVDKLPENQRKAVVGYVTARYA